MFLRSWTTCALACAMALPLTAQKSPNEVPLQRARYKEGQLRAGLGLTKAPPLDAFHAKIGTTTVAFFDLDGDGVLQPQHDGLALPPGPFVVPLPAKLLLPTGQFTLTFAGTTTVRLERDDLGALATLAAQAAELTEVRVRAGVTPAVLDPVLCAHCELHCDYLKGNKIQDGSAGVSTHDEHKDKPGHTPEGEAAGRASVMAFQVSLRDAIREWLRSSWHGVPLVDPRLQRFGVAAKHGVVMLHNGDRGARALTADFVHPADGATHIDRLFTSRGEDPNPLPGSNFGIGCGMPIFVLLANPSRVLKSATVSDARGKPVEGTTSSPQRPANPQWPTNSNLALFLPSKPLLSNTTYRVRFVFEDGECNWSFTTGK